MTIEFRGGPRDGQVLKLRQAEAVAFYFHVDDSQSADALGAHEAQAMIRKGFALHRYSFGGTRTESGARVFLYDTVFPGSKQP